MILQLISLIAVILVTYHVFKTARDNGRSAIGWAVLTVGVGLGFQWILPIFIGIVLAVYYMSTGMSVDELQAALETPAMLITFACFGLSFIGMFLILKFVMKIPDDPVRSDVPPPPPSFERSE